MSERQQDTTIGGTARSFPTTAWSDVLVAGDLGHPERAERLNRLLALYWKPVYVYIRVAWKKPVEDAKDLTQAFFAHLLDTDTIARARAERGSFRSYLKASLKYFLINANRAAEVRKPVTALVSLDARPEEFEQLGPAAPDETPESAYERQWCAGLMDASVGELHERLTREGKALYFEVFKAYVIEPEQTPGLAATGETQSGAPTYGEVAARFRIQESDVRNHLSACRRLLRTILAERVRAYSETEAGVEAELEALLNP
jgi:RNA polymerase sigma-70 factor (ECF subfamily)